ncbi:MAG TPA: Gldg family protein, partial [Myxococcales bacterium]|nr:Gldg family protein [Myxococcales bacterium]
FKKYELRQGQNAIVLTRGEGKAESHTTVNTPSEQELTNGLIKITAVGEKKVYFLVGHGEWSPDEDPSQGPNGPPVETSITELKRDLTQEGYAPETLHLAGKTEVPRDAALVIIAGAKQPVSPKEAEVLEKYLDEGGRVAFFAEAQVEAGLDKLLAAYGVQVDKGILADMQFAVDSPYNVLSIFYGNHEITRLLRTQPLNTQFITARGLTLLKEGVSADVKAEPLVLTSPQAWEESTPDQNPQPSSGEKVGSIPIAAVVTKAIGAGVQQKRNDEARLVVFGDSELLVDAFWGHEGNRNLVLNALAWTTNQAQKVTIRPPDRDISTIDLDKPMLDRIRLVSTDLLPLAVLGLGMAIWLTRRNK